MLALFYMAKQKELLNTLRMGGSDAVTAFVENCVSVHEAGGGDAVSKWVAVALPELPEPERAALVTLLLDSLLTSYDVEFESFWSERIALAMPPVVIRVLRRQLHQLVGFADNLS